MAILKAKELACYISEKVANALGHTISPVKLQKSLYFCFAYWGGFVRKGKMQGNEKEIDVSGLDEILFDDRIEAWVYGPVVPDVYRENNLMNYKNDHLFDNNDRLKDFIDNLIDDITPVSDFRLVDISHMDKSWSENFDYNDLEHNKEIKKEKIIDEYSKK